MVLGLKPSPKQSEIKKLSEIKTTLAVSVIDATMVVATAFPHHSNRYD